MSKSKKKRRDSELKLGYGLIYDYGEPVVSKKKKKKVSKASFDAEDKEWGDVSAIELRKLMLQGWKTANFLSHYGVSLDEFYRKIRFGWKLSA